MKHPVGAVERAAWKQTLQQLVAQGGAGVSAILEFMHENRDVRFGEAAPTLGYASACHAMIDALVQIGGPEATAAIGQLLQTTGAPREIAQLARNLEGHGSQPAPGQLRAARFRFVRLGGGRA